MTPSECLRRVAALPTAESDSVLAMATPLRTSVGHRNGGQPNKGPRRFMSVRLPESLADDVIREADRMGLTISDYMVVVAAKAHGHEIPEYVQRKLHAAEGQSQLPLGA